MLEAKVIGYSLLTIIILVATVVYLSVKHGRNKANKEMDEASKQAALNIINNSDEITRIVSEMDEDELDSKL